MKIINFLLKTERNTVIERSMRERLKVTCIAMCM